MIFTKKYHWYVFSFQSLSDHKIAVACSYVGYTRKPSLISKVEVDRQKEQAGVPQGAILIAVTYLGRGTSKEMTNG